MKQEEIKEKNQAEIAQCMDKLKDSPIVSADLYHIQLSNLCDVINFILVDAGDEIESINEFAKKGNVNLVLCHAEFIQERLWQIATIVDVIKEKVSSGDYAILEELFYYYGEYRESMSIKQ